MNKQHTAGTGGKQSDANAQQNTYTIGKLTQAGDTPPPLSGELEHSTFQSKDTFEFLYKQPPTGLYCPSGCVVILLEAESEPAQVGLELAM